jgi:hypothetical protein
MTDTSEKTARLLSRREFMTKATIAMGATATLAAMTRSLPFSPFKRSGTDLSLKASIFTPRPGSRLAYWRNKMNQFRLR